MGDSSIAIPNLLERGIIMNENRLIENLHWMKQHLTEKAVVLSTEPIVETTVTKVSADTIEEGVISRQTVNNTIGKKAEPGDIIKSSDVTKLI